MRFVATAKAVLVALALAGPALAQPTTATLTGIVSSDRTLDASQVYSLDGEVYVESGVTLTIPAGTVLKGKQSPSNGNNVSALIIQRGGRLVADGRADAPIIFTTEFDDVNDPFDTNEAQRSLWGGVILLGNATNNRGVRFIEGVPNTDRSRYGCGDAGFPCDDNDDSGIVRYVSIRHGGFTLDADIEVNGLTLGAVGRGTVLDYIEVFANSDDSFEFFGGTVNASHLVGVFSGDDDLDWDTGFQGQIQFAFSLKDESGDVGRCVEGDGSAEPFTAVGQSSPTVSNLTCIGSGLGSTPGGDDSGGPTLKLRENTRGFIYNSVFTDWQTVNGGIDLEARDPASVSVVQNFLDGTLDIRNNIFFDYSVGNTAAAIVRGDNAAVEAAIAERNRFVPVGLVSVAREANLGLDPRPGFDAAAASGGDFSFGPLQTGFFTPTTYLGAFEPNARPWAAGWTALSQMQYFPQTFVAAETGPLAELGFRVAVSPNPARGAASVTVELPEASAARLSVFDVLGREVTVVANQTMAAGSQTFRVGQTLPAGVYVARLQTSQGVTAVQFTVVR